MTHRNTLGWAALVVSLAALASSQLTTRPLPATQENPEAGRRTARELSDAFNAVAESVRPSVVQINVQRGTRFRARPAPGDNNGEIRQIDPQEMEEMLRRFFGPNGPGFPFERPQGPGGIGTGSGFVYDTKGHILTNNHVVENATRIVVTFHDGAQAPAQIVGTYPDADIAVIKVDLTSYPPLKLGSTRNLHVGDWVLAVGSPFGLSQTVTAGIISATERDNLGINRFEAFLQTDASINPGNSGGPLVDMDGRVVGINSAIATMTRASAGVGFAIPIDMAVRFANQLIQKGKIEPVIMGVNVEPLNRGLARQLGLPEHTAGVVITEVGEGSPAARAGLKVGDVITSFDAMPVRTREGLQTIVYTSEAGKSYPVTVLRDGKPLAFNVAPEPLEAVTRGMRRPRPERAPRADSVEQTQANPFGFGVTPLTPELAERYGYQQFDSGFVVTTVEPNSPAEDSGLERGDLITRYIKDRTIVPAGSLEDFEAYVAEADEIAIYVEDVNHRLPGEFKTLTRPKPDKP
ncbi:MAG: hypothetical protein KatS3mg108_0938 [Isosphaeraceae bacterium]|jgi:serine protease Do|nr:MAG: hypothetical protein KatS3mg108_0938 [Isosphaeraceae bacterium]